MADVAPELLEKVKKDFDAKMAADEKVKAIQKRIAQGTATSEDISLYSMQVGDHAAEALQANLTAGTLPNGNLYYNIADRVVMPQLIDNYNLVEDIAEQIQMQLNEAAGIGLQPTRVGINQGRTSGIIDALTKNPEDGIDAVKWLLNEPIKNYTQSVADEFIKENAKAQANAGLSARVERRVYGGCCDWCRGLAGVYDYGTEPGDFYRKHEECRCIILFNPSKKHGKYGKMQDATTKKWYNTNTDAVRERDERVAQGERFHINEKKTTTKKAAQQAEKAQKTIAAAAKDTRTEMQKEFDEVWKEARRKSGKLKTAEQMQSIKEMQDRQKKLRIEAQKEMDKMRKARKAG